MAYLITLEKPFFLAQCHCLLTFLASSSFDLLFYWPSCILYVVFLVVYLYYSSTSFLSFPCYVYCLLSDGLFDIFSIISLVIFQMFILLFFSSVFPAIPVSSITRFLLHYIHRCLYRFPFSHFLCICKKAPHSTLPRIFTI